VPDDGERPHRTLVHHLGDPLPDELTLPLGGEFTVTLHGTPAYAWTPVATSDPGTVALTTSGVTDGTATATARALRPGAATLQATATFTGDRFGPPTRLWRLRVRITNGRIPR
jgi:hypothetical protein